ncbi:CAP-Gly domain-containing linker protein 1-like isoform X3 [Adelges cooleyi]|uniref:CAP-Gly domain-containing linker protein 1-like isoform X3 n=1 Tax=Adelges cooleyi TaxID=133065 RepID=UPI00217FF368|nr:CAP-Gly domain-containing linker protein 1-like isoform X3 [Adelges cooleyi]
MPNPIFEERILPKKLDLYCRADDGYHSTVTKLNGGPSNAKRLADIPYTGKQNGVSKEERKSSSGSDYSMGDSRRLSEAGVRRSSGNSVVLTEDTDSFIIGDRVWVGGTKPGQIAYIGETNFGTGDWAGIVLDEPIGKNDGSVGGTKYFQCSPKKGIFARLTNLTNAPLGSAEDSIVQSSFAKAKPLGFSTPMPKRQTSNVTAPVSTAAVQRSVVKNVNQTPASRGNSELKVGDRVIISSGQGSKLGVLRYRGAAQFAPGEWCGIELDDPLGKNNGSVEGIKYFECEDKFGLFAPIGKVSKSPMSASRMSSNCAIHKTNKRSPGSMSGSMISGVTATTMSSIPTRVRLGVASLRYKQTKVSDLDKLKTQLTQLKNENELLRLQVTKAANQADVAEKQLEETLKAQIAKSSQDNSLLTLQSQLDTLKKQLDDEREKFQNLQFTIEEQNVANVELQNKNGELLIKIKEQEADLEKERNLAKDVEVETMKNFEKEEELCRLKEELDSLKKVINNNEDELQKSVSNLSTEVIDKDALLNTLRQQLNESTQNHERVLKETSEKLASTTERLNKVIEEKDKKIEQNQEMIDQLNEGIKSLSALKNEEHDEIVNGLKNEITKLKDEHKSVFDQNERDVKKAIEQHELMVKELNDKLDGLSDTKSQEISRLQEKYNDALRLQSADQQTIANLKLELNATVDSLNQLKINNFIFSKDVLEAALKQQMESAMVTVTHLEHQFAKAVVITDKQIKTCNTAVLQIKEQIVKSKAQTETLYEDKLREKEGEIEILTKKLNELTDIVEQREIGNKELNDQLTKALKTAEEKSNQIIELEKKYNDLDTQQNLTRNELEKEMAGQLKTLKDELEDIKLKKSAMQEEHEKYVREMVNSIGVKEEQLNDNKVVIENLKSSLADLQTAKQNDLDAQSERLAQIENEKQENFKRHNSELTVRDEQIKTLSNQLTNVVEQHKIANKELNDQLTKALKTAEEKSNQIIELEKKFNDLDTQQNLSRNELEKELAGQLKTLNDELADLKTKKITMQEEHEKYVKETVNSISVKEEQLNANKIIIENFKSSLAELETAKQNDLDAQSKRLAQLENEKQENLKRHDSELIARDEQIKTLSNQLTNVVEQHKIANKELNDQLTKALKTAEEKSNKIIELEKKYNDLNTQQNLSRNELEKELAGQLKTLNDELADLKTKKITMQEEHEKYVKEMVNSIGVKEEQLNDNKVLIETLKSSLAKLQTAKQHDLDAQSERLAQLENEKQEYLKRHDSELIARDEQIKTLSDQLEQTLNEKQKQHSSYSDLQKTLNTEISNYQNEIDQLRDQINDLQSMIALDGDKASDEIELSRKELENIKSENTKLLDALKTLEHEKTTLEHQLELIGTLEKDVKRLNEEIEEKSKTIAANDSKIEHISEMAKQADVVFNNKLKAKDDEIERLFKVGEDKLVAERSTLEKQTKLILEEKEKENAGLREKLSELYDVKIGLEKQLEISKTHELQVNTLNETVQEKMKTIAENNAKIDELNDLVTKVKHDFEVSTKEKNNRINEVLKGETEKLELEKIVEQYKMSMDEKDREIVELKNCLQEVAGKKTEKELILRLESVNTDLEKEKTRAVNLESLKCDLEKKISEYKKDLNSMEETKTEMSKSLDKQREHNTEQINHIKSEVLLLNDENLKVKSEMEDYKSKLSALQKTLNDKNQETETLKLLLSEKSTSNSEMERLETLLEKQCGNREHLEFRIQELTDENHRLNERIENIGKPLQDNNLINEKQKLEVKYEETYSMLKIKENHILVLQTELNSYKLKDIAKVKNHNVQEKSDAHILAEKNEEVKMLNSIILSLHKKLSAVMETDVSDYEIDKNPNGLTKEEYQKLYKTAKNNVKLKECENMTLQQEISKLKAENDRFAEYKTKCDSLEKDKKKLQQIVVNNESSRDGDNNKTGTKSETAKILEEKDWQINLLNNIIADLHAKVSDNKFKMESLEKQILDSGSGQNKKARIRTARLYCEQCEIFDAHDTEDCPEKPESPKFQKKHRIVNNDNDDTLVEEPFCVCCDMFGHTANECDSSLTF